MEKLQTPGVISPTGAGWYDIGTLASISTDVCVAIVSGSSGYRPAFFAFSMKAILS